MHPYKQISVGNKGKLRFTPLGGLGEIGGNIAVLEDDESAIIIDVGMRFSPMRHAWSRYTKSRLSPPHLIKNR